MADPITAIAQTVQALVAVIELAGRLVDKAPRESSYRNNLEAVRMDLGLVRDCVVKIEGKKKKKLPEGVRKWMEEARKVVSEANQLLEKIERGDETNGSQTANCCFSFSNNNADELTSLKERLRHIADRVNAVLALLDSDRKLCAIL